LSASSRLALLPRDRRNVPPYYGLSCESSASICSIVGRLALVFEGQLLEVSKFRHAHRGSSDAECTLNDDAVLALAQDEPDRGLISRVSQEIVDGRQVEVHFASVFGFERRHLQIDHHETPQLEMVKEQIDPELLAADLDWVLAADEREAHAQLQQKFPDLLNESGFELPFPSLLRECQEIEVVGIFEKLLGQVGLGRRQGLAEVRERLPLGRMSPPSICIARTFRLQPFWAACSIYQSRSAGLLTLSSRMQLWNHGNCAAACCTICSSGQASAKAFMYLRLRTEKPSISREAALQIAGEVLDDFGPPTFLFLTAADLRADAPVEEDQLAADGDRSPYL
jgi:hypothetical protein